MSVPKVSGIAQILDGFAPRKLAESWDNVGLLLGDGSRKVNSIMVCLDTPEWVVEEAINKKVDMLICHHPLIFNPLKRITNDDPIGRKIMKLIKNNIAVYAMHTNFDSTIGGMNDALMERLGFGKSEILDPRALEKLFKLIVFIPKEHEQSVAAAIFEAGAGNIGNYRDCGFGTDGTGFFTPNESADPFIGKANQKEIVEEIRFETIVPGNLLGKVIKSMLTAHPYEEVAYDIIPLENKLENYGLGRIGELEEPVTLQVYAESVKNLLGIKSLKIIGNGEKTIKKVAVIGGAGSSYWQKAKSKGADVLITGDISYHTQVDALEGGIALIDGGHFGTEKIIMSFMTKKLRELLREKGYKDVLIEASLENNEIEKTM